MRRCGLWSPVQGSRPESDAITMAPLRVWCSESRDGQRESELERELALELGTGHAAADGRNSGTDISPVP